jgi:uncharacterized Zn-binding protein involved in type VI secretion
MSGLPATRVTDQFAHSSALGGLLTGLAIGLAAGVFIVATGGVGAIAVGAAIGVAGAGGLAGQAIGGTVMGPPTGAIATGSPNVMTNKLPQAATVIGLGPCAKESGVPQQVATGAETVLINAMPAARKDEKMTCSATIISGSPDVLIGGASVQVLPMEPEVPTWLSNTMLAMAFGGGLIATGGIAAAYGGVVALGSFGGGLLGGHLGGMGGQWAAQQMGFGATGQAIGGVLGGFAGGMLGGGAGFKGGSAFNSRYAITTNGLGSNFGNVRITPRNPATGPQRGPDGRFTSSGTGGSRLNRSSEYPSGYRAGVRDKVLDANTIQSGPNKGKVLTQDGEIVARDNPNLTIEHNKPVVEHWNETGYNSSRATRNDFYNNTDNMSIRTGSANSADGGRMSASGVRYRQDTGPDYGK